jgi:glutamate dehydrogenase
MSVDSTDHRIAVAALLEAAARLPGFAGRSGLSTAADSFLRQIADDAVADDMGALTATDLAGLAHGFWSWTAQRRASAQDIRLYSAMAADGAALDRDILEICSPDMPFLVDSVMGEIGAQGIQVLAMFHPIVETVRDEDGVRGADGMGIKESMIQVHLPQLSASRRDAVMTGVREVLADVRVSVLDFNAMKRRMQESLRDLAGAKTRAPDDEISEAISFLKWVDQDHFVYLGARSYDYPLANDRSLADGEPVIREDLNLGILRDPMRTVLRRINEPSVLSEKVRAYLEEPTPLIVAKSNLRSRVHRRGVADYIGIKRYDGDGNVVGEDRFIGLFTSEAYDQMARDVPLLRRKVERVIARSGYKQGSHSDKALRNIVENYPRDELFQIDDEDLYRIALGVQHLMDRPRTRIFVRRDRFDRFFSIMVYVPRDRYNSDVREKMGALLANAYGGRLSAFYPQFGEAPLARVHFIIGVTPNQHLEPDVAALETEMIALTRTWDDALEAAAMRVGADIGGYFKAFPAGYREAFGAEEALADIEALTQVQPGRMSVRAFRDAGAPDTQLRAKFYSSGSAAALSAMLPILGSMGLFVESETPFTVKPSGPESPTLWVQDLYMRDAHGKPLDYAAIENSFEEAVSAIWGGLGENDGFNRLIVTLGMSWREAALIRALARWRGQTGLDPSQTVQEQALADWPGITRQLLVLFKTKFDPAGPSKKEREAQIAAINDDIAAQLDKVPNLEADRVLRRIAAMINAMKRTNYFQPGPDGAARHWMSFKIAPRELDFVPEPKPYREIWVWSPQVEGTHLRFGPVARGGLRWSDRRDDFRTEVLGLVKAQQVKNAVIVPVGSKGGFFPKQLPRSGNRDEIQAAAIEAYKTFLRGLLDLTDNIGPDGAIIAPKSVVRWDDDDPYLVVAADKGTATFSDIANGISADYGHWLGDAFASGGSVGYDHKKMGITARGGWEAVKRHFREIGHDTQTEPFTVIGVGDMSGDVFGNGMLLSKQIKLVAAFDHRDIFIDPDPDPASSHAERVRMFALPRSSWADYDRTLISSGGGIFPRSAKSIPLNDQLRALTGLEGAETTPTELMHALLKASCDLMWFGGIGTYVKSTSETHSDAGDKANDAIRVNGAELKARVIGEGANLGLTQLGRIEAALSGVRLNTDAIDNSAGVDSSDHEVNIKILLNGLVRSGQMSEDGRDELLAAMTDDVGLHVLKHNYNQTLAISLQEATAALDVDAHLRFMERLESAGKLNRKIEFLPDNATAKARADQGKGLTRPELSVLTAYGKIQLFDELIASDAPDDPWFRDTLVQYFPKGCRQFDAAMDSHRLRREIIATVVCNEMVDLGGATFMDRVRESALADTGAIVRAFAAARAIFKLDPLIAEIKALDLKVPASVQTALMLDVIAVLRRQSFWLARRASHPGARALPDIKAMVDAYQVGVEALAPRIGDLVSPLEAQRLIGRIDALEAQGAPAKLARAVAMLRPLISATDIIDLSASRGWSVEATARLYHEVGASVGFDEMRFAAGQTAAPDHWDRVATRRIIEDLMGEQGQITASVCDLVSHSGGALLEKADKPTGKWARDCVAAWLTLNAVEVAKMRDSIAELQAAGGWTFAKLAIANAQLNALAGAARSA